PEVPVPAHEAAQRAVLQLLEPPQLGEPVALARKEVFTEHGDREHVEERAVCVERDRLHDPPLPARFRREPVLSGARAARTTETTSARRARSGNAFAIAESPWALDVRKRASARRSRSGESSPAARARSSARRKAASILRSELPTLAPAPRSRPD